MNSDSDLVVEPLASAPDANWDETVAGLGGYVFHSRAFGMACAELGESPLFLVLRRHGRDVGYALASAVRTRLRPLGWARDVLQLASPPVLLPEVTKAEAVEALEVFARSHRYGHVHIDSFGDPRVEDPFPAESDRIRRLPRLDHRVSIGPDFATTLSRMATAHRRKIRKALTAPFTFEEQSTPEGALRMHAVHEETFVRRHALGQKETHAWRIEDFRRRMDAYLRQGIIRFHFTVLDGETLSAMGTMSFGRTSYYLVGGTTREGYERDAAYAMFAHTFQRLITEGITEFNLGGTGFDAREESSPDHGLYRFKVGYGGRAFDCAHVHMRVIPWRWWPSLE
jgi:hypothetical protein